MVAEGEELQTNLLQASQRIPASSGVLDEVFGAHRTFHVVRIMFGLPPNSGHSVGGLARPLCAIGDIPPAQILIEIGSGS